MGKDVAKSALELIYSLRAVRDFREDEVDEEKMQKVIEAATMAPSAGNTQPWEFIVITSRKEKENLGKTFSATWHKRMDRIIPRMPAKTKKIYEAASRLVDSTEKVPALILVCLDLAKSSKAEESRYASVYPAVQNLMLAAKALGLGTCPTTHGVGADRGENEVKSMVGIPEGIKIVATIYLGFPARKYGPPHREPVRIHYDKW